MKMVYKFMNLVLQKDTLMKRCILDIRDVQMLKSPLDYQEQKLKIANLRAQAEQDRGSVTVTLEGTVKDYAR